MTLILRSTLINESALDLQVHIDILYDHLQYLVYERIPQLKQIIDDKNDPADKRYIGDSLIKIEAALQRITEAREQILPKLIKSIME